MTVQAILNLKGGDVATGDPSMTLGQVCARLGSLKIGALVMVDTDHKVIGIISERDVVRVLGAHGAKVLEDEARQHMTHKVITCGRRATVDEVMEIMTRGRFRHVPVVDNGALVGIVSIGDVVKKRMADVEREAQEIRNYIATA